MKLTFTLIALFFSVLLMAQKAGTLDSSFGNNGKVVTFSETAFLSSNAAASQSDGSIIATGGISFVGQEGGFFAIKYSKKGLLDSNFGSQGLATMIGTGIGQAVALQPDNKIVITGYAYDLFGPYYITVARFNSNGSIDSSFGSNGFIKTLAGDQGQGIAIQPDGKILIVGVHTGNAITLRYLPDGSPDESFGNNGAVETKFGNSISSGNTILIQPDNKIVIAGRTDKAILLGRYNSDGSLDETFGNGGKVLYDIGSGVDEINDIVLQPDGKIIAAGTASSKFSDTSNAIVLRYTSDGNLDESFGNNGLIIFQLQTNTTLTSVALQKDGKIIAAGGVDDANAIHQHFLVERFDTNGIIDSSFDNDGYQITEIDESDFAKSVILQEDGKIVLAGSAFNDSVSGPSEHRIALCRYNNDDKTKKQIIIKKIKHYIQTHNDAQATTLNKVSIYPNPAQNILHVAGLSLTQTKLTVVDFAGNIIVSRELSPVPSNTGVVSNGYDLNVASLHAGNYLLKIEMNGEVVTRQFVKE